MDAFERWAKTENLEERWADSSLIDPAVLSLLEGRPEPG
jgi:hypothetical protein